MAAAVTLLAPPLPQGALTVLSVGPGELLDTGSVARWLLASGPLPPFLFPLSACTPYNLLG